MRMSKKRLSIIQVNGASTPVKRDGCSTKVQPPRPELKNLAIVSLQFRKHLLITSPLGCVCAFFETAPFSSSNFVSANSLSLSVAKF